MNRLIGITDLILSDEWDGLDENNFIMIIEYAKFLKQKLELWMFVPCDLDGNVLEKACESSVKGCRDCACSEYEKAKKRCLFEILSYEEDSKNYWYFGITEFNLIGVDKVEIVESLATYGLTLTETAKKQLGWI